MITISKIINTKDINFVFQDKIKELNTDKSDVEIIDTYIRENGL